MPLPDPKIDRLVEKKRAARLEMARNSLDQLYTMTFTNLTQEEVLHILNARDLPANFHVEANSYA